MSGLAPTRQYHHCRQCRAKLAIVVETDALAFCCRDCHCRFYLGHCLVCEREKSRKSPSPYCSAACADDARKNPSLRRLFYPLADSAEKSRKSWFLHAGMMHGTRTTNPPESDCGTGTFLRDLCPRGWVWVGHCENLEFALRREATKNCVAFVLFDGAEWVIKHPQTYPSSPIFTSRDDALRAAASLAAAALPRESALAKRERQYRQQVDQHLSRPTPLQFSERETSPTAPASEKA
jgi:hypothetical protein